MKYTLINNGHSYVFDASKLEGKRDGDGNTFDGSMAIGPDDDDSPYYAFWGFVHDDDEDEISFKKLDRDILYEMCSEWGTRDNYVHIANVDGWFAGTAWPTNQSRSGDEEIR